MKDALRRWLWAVALACGLALLATCGGGATATPSSAAPTTQAASQGPSAAPTVSTVPASPVVGVVLTIDSKGLGDVKGFTLRTNGGQIYTFVIGQLENGAQFPPGHLAEHQATGSAVRVSFREQAGQLVAYRLDDAS